MFGGNFPGFFGGHGRPGDDDEDESQDYHNNHRDGDGEGKETDTDPNNDFYYKVLDVDKKADTAAIRKAFKQRSLKGEYRHPDRGGDAEKFKILNEAYSVLQDPEKRDIYDQYGVKGLKQDQ
jgi:DnaJ family protein A protein 2